MIRAIAGESKRCKPCAAPPTAAAAAVSQAGLPVGAIDAVCLTGNSPVDEYSISQLCCAEKRVSCRKETPRLFVLVSFFLITETTTSGRLLWFFQQTFCVQTEEKTVFKRRSSHSATGKRMRGSRGPWECCLCLVAAYEVWNNSTGKN